MLLRSILRHAWVLLLPGLTAFAPGGTQAQARPERVASLNLCTDQLLLALADRSQIASLSRLARDPSIAFLADQAGAVLLNDGSAESIIIEPPDLVLTGTYGQREQAALLSRKGVDVLSLGPWEDLADGRSQIRTLARRLGHSERGEALISQIDAALERARGTIPGGRSILSLERGGWVTSPRSLLGEILVRMGFKLHQETLGLTGGGVAHLEAIVTTPPDFLLVDAAKGQAVDNGTALLLHPALAEAVPPSRRLVLPAKLAICGGPSTPAAIDYLGVEVRAKLR